MKKYKIIFKALECDKWCCLFIRNLDLGISEYGIPVKINIVVEKEPTDEDVEKIKEILELAKDNKEIKQYYTNVELEKIEILGDDNGNDNNK